MPPVVWLLLLVPLIVEMFWVFWPAFNSFQLSFTKWSGVGPAEPVGLKNYQTLIHDPIFHTAIKNNVLWIIGFGGLSVMMGLALAVALNKPRRGVGVYRSAIYLPMVFSLAVTGLFWRVLYQPDGPINTILAAIGHRHRPAPVAGRPEHGAGRDPDRRRSGVRPATSWCSTWPG